MRQKVIDFVTRVANDNKFGYDQINRWGNPDFDCSGLVITAWENAGVPVRKFGATYTGDMKPAFLAAGFVDVTKQVDRITGKGLEPADVLLKIKTASRNGHTAIYIGNGRIVQAQSNETGGKTGGKPGDQTGKEIFIRSYYNSPWDIVLRYPEQEDDEMKNPYEEPTKSYKKDEYFTGNDAYWFQWMLREIGHLIELDGKAGPITWESLNYEIAQSGNPGGDADEKVRSYMKAYVGMVNPAEMKNPYQEPTKSYKKDEYFTGNDAYWFQWMLREIGHLIELDGKAGPITWNAIHAEQSKAGIPVGDANELTRRILKGEGSLIRLEIALQTANKELEIYRTNMNEIRRLAGG